MSERIWLITGTNSGFGRAIAEAALEAGDRIVAAVRRPETVKDLVESAPERVRAVQLDITEQHTFEGTVSDILAHEGRIDVLVNNAGRGLAGPAETTSDHELRDLMDLHFFGPTHLTRAVLPSMREQRSGAIVQMSSQAGRYSFPGISGYSATKFALEGWSEALAAEVQPHGIRVLIVEPGAFRTSFNEPGVLQFAAANSDAYRDQVQPVLDALAGADGHQPGDPAKAGQAIVSTVGADKAPLRLALGSDAAETIADSLGKAQSELAQWDSVARDADF